MHYHAEVWIRTIEDRDEHEIEDIVESVMTPHQEEYGTSGDNFWDWYEIGGRWSHGKKSIIPLSELPADLECYTLLTEMGDCYHDQIWTGDTFIPNPDFDGKIIPKLKQLGIEDGYLVTVDYHC